MIIWWIYASGTDDIPLIRMRWGTEIWSNYQDLAVLTSTGVRHFSSDLCVRQVHISVERESEREGGIFLHVCVCINAWDARERSSHLVSSTQNCKEAKMFGLTAHSRRETEHRPTCERGVRKERWRKKCRVCVCPLLSLSSFCNVLVALLNMFKYS